MIIYHTKDLTDSELEEIEKVIKPAFIYPPTELEKDLVVLRSKYLQTDSTLRKD